MGEDTRTKAQDSLASLFRSIDAAFAARHGAPCRTSCEGADGTAVVTIAGKPLRLAFRLKDSYRGAPAYWEAGRLVACVGEAGLSAAEQDRLRDYLALAAGREPALAEALAGALAAAPGKARIVKDLEFRSGGKEAARNRVLDVTLRCSQRCVFCPVGLERKDLPLARLKAALGAGRIPAGTELLLTGGEPLLSPALVPFARWASRRGFASLTLLTNAVRLADPRVARGVLEAGITRLFVSFHSHRDADYDALTGTRGQRRLAVRGIANALSLPFERVTFNVVLTRRNYRGLPGTARFLARLGRGRNDRGGNGRGRTGRERNGPTAIELFPSVMNDNPRWTELSVPYARLVPYIRRALKEACLPIVRFMGDCAMPVCVGGLFKAAPALAPQARLDSPTWYAPKDWTPRRVPPGNGALRVKAASCRRCRLDPACSGLALVYARRYGVMELNPV